MKSWCLFLVVALQIILSVGSVEIPKVEEKPQEKQDQKLVVQEVKAVNNSIKPQEDVKKPIEKPLHVNPVGMLHFARRGDGAVFFVNNVNDSDEHVHKGQTHQKPSGNRPGGWGSQESKESKESGEKGSHGSEGQNGGKPQGGNGGYKGSSESHEQAGGSLTWKGSKEDDSDESEEQHKPIKPSGQGHGETGDKDSEDVSWQKEQHGYGKPSKDSDSEESAEINKPNKPAGQGHGGTGGKDSEDLSWQGGPYGHEKPSEESGEGSKPSWQGHWQSGGKHSAEQGGHNNSQNNWSNNGHNSWQNNWKDSKESEESGGNGNNGHGGNKDSGEGHVPWLQNQGSYGGYHVTGINRREMAPMDWTIIPLPFRPQKGAIKPVWGYVEQYIDHFSIDDKRTFKMRFACNDQFYLPGGPLIPLLLGMGEVDEKYVMSGQAYDIAAETHGLPCVLEHRFTGKSTPKGALTDKLLSHLTTDNTLRDISTFINFMKHKLPGTTKVGLIGCGYGGNLAVWTAVKYPHLVTTVYSSDASFDIKPGAYEAVLAAANRIGLADKTCFRTIVKAREEVSKLFGSSKGRKYLASAYNVCNGLEKEDKEHLFWQILETVHTVPSFGNSHQLYQACVDFLNIPGPAINKSNTYVKILYDNKCLTNLDDYVEIMKSPIYAENSGRQWLFAQCNEMGLFKATFPEKKPFGNIVPVSYFYDVCRRVFGKKFTKEYIDKAIARTRLVYGGVKPAVQKAIYVYNSQNTMHRSGVLQPPNDQTRVFIIQGEPMCSDFYSITKDDSKYLQLLKAKIKDTFKKWLTS